MKGVLQKNRKQEEARKPSAMVRSNRKTGEEPTDTKAEPQRKKGGGVGEEVRAGGGEYI